MMVPRSGLAVVVSTITASLGSYAPAIAQPLPAADRVIDAFVQAIGGRAAHLSPTSIRSSGVIEMPGMGIRGEFEVLQFAPDQMMTRVVVPGVGEILSGFDGEVGWSVNPLTGSMVMEGGELAETSERANILAGLRDREVIPERETVELSEYDGEGCWRVRLVWLSGRESFDCYSQDTGLLIASEDSQTSPMGILGVVTRFSDYREFHGMILPTRLVQSSMGQVQEMLVREVEIDRLDAYALAPPPSIRTLLDDGR